MACAGPKPPWQPLYSRGFRDPAPWPAPCGGLEDLELPANPTLGVALPCHPKIQHKDPALSMAKSEAPKRRRYVPAVGKRLNVLLAVVFGLFALLSVNGLFLASVRVLGYFTGRSYENLFYLYNFLVHLVLGFVLIAPLVIFTAIHMKNTRQRRNRRALKAGYGLAFIALLLVLSGVLLTRIEGILEVKNQTVRSAAYWAHVITPLLAVWMFILHRLAGRKIRWNIGLRWAVVGVVFAGISLLFLTHDPRAWDVEGNPDGAQYFFPSLARTVSGDFIPAHVLDNDEYCMRCHQDVHESWEMSVHRFASFNNPVYLASIRETRQAMMERDGNIQGSRFCAGCHDPVPFFSGAFNDPNYDDVNHPTAHSGITCTACHAITHVNTPRGNADYTIEEPIHYPFTFSDNPLLSWVNEQLVKAKPGFHKKTFLKPLHQEAEFCGSCHKVHLPKEVNDYKWLRGQNHYDNYHLSGVSGHGVQSFYYPPKAEHNCNNCHMPLMPSDDFGSQDFDGSGVVQAHDHMFPSANAAIPHLEAELNRLTKEQANIAEQKHRKFTDGVMRLDIFGIKEEGRIDGALTAPLRPEVPTLQPGGRYLLEVVIRTKKMGHIFTQGTVDSNEVWVEMSAESDQRLLGRSGGLHPDTRELDPWSHMVNAFVLDREGNRISRRNAQDIFIPLYNHQIPPGAADVVHYLLEVPENQTGSITVNARLRYRKFDNELMRFVTEDEGYVNNLPILELAEDRVVFPVAGGDVSQNPASEIPEWERWNDYGIGLLRKGQLGELRQAEHAFQQVERLGRPEGPLHQARVYIKEGRVADEAPAALRRARDFEPPANEWSVLWFSGLVNKQNGKLEDAIRNFEQILEGGFEQAQGREFDFRQDYNLLNELAGTVFERAKQMRGEKRKPQREALMNKALGLFHQVLDLDPENVTAHYGLNLIYRDLGDDAKAAEHSALHGTYKVDDNARDLAIANARIKYPAANHAAEAVVIYDLQRDGAYGMPQQ